VKTFFFSFLISSLSTLASAPNELETAENFDKTILDAENEVFFDGKLGKLVATPNARLRSGNILLIAKRIELDQKQNEAVAIGNVILSDGEFRLLSESMQINLISGDFNATNVKFGIYPWAIQAEKISRTNTTVQGLESDLYFLDKEKYEPNLKIRTLRLDQEKNAVDASGVFLRMGNQTIGQLPSFSGKISKKSLRFDLRAGNRKNLGYYLGTGGKWELNSALLSNTEITAYSKRGILVSPNFEWDSYSIGSINSGTVESGWIYDQGKSRGNDIHDLPLGRDRSFLHAYSVNRVRDNWRIAGQMEWNKDSEVIRDFHRDQFYQNQWNDSFAELAYEGRIWRISTFSRWQPNQYQATSAQLPTIRFDLAPSPIAKSTFYHSMNFEFSALRDKNGFGKLTQKSTKLDGAYKISRPIRMGNGLIYSPHLSYRRQNYSLDGPNARRSMGEWGNELRYEIYGDYNWKNATWGIDQIRHVVGFSVSHRKVSRLSASRESLIPQIDHPVSELNLTPIDLTDHVQADGLNPYEVVRLGYENEFLTRNGNKSHRIASINFFHDLYHHNQSNDHSPEEFFAGFAINPAPWIFLRGQSKLDTDLDQVIRNSFSIQLVDGTFNKIEIGYFKYLTFLDQWGVSAMHRWSESKIFHGSISIEKETDNIPYWHIGIEHQSSPAWTWLLSVSGRKGTAKENETEFAVSTRIFAF
jgi:LPS-assembly protein